MSLTLCGTFLSKPTPCRCPAIHSLKQWVGGKPENDALERLGRFCFSTFCRVNGEGGSSLARGWKLAACHSNPRQNNKHAPTRWTNSANASSAYHVTGKKMGKRHSLLHCDYTRRCYINVCMHCKIAIYYFKHIYYKFFFFLNSSSNVIMGCSTNNATKHIIVYRVENFW